MQKFLRRLRKEKHIEVARMIHKAHLGRQNLWLQGPAQNQTSQAPNDHHGQDVGDVIRYVKPASASMACRFHSILARRLWVSPERMISGSHITKDKWRSSSAFRVDIRVQNSLPSPGAGSLRDYWHKTMAACPGHKGCRKKSLDLLQYCTAKSGRLAKVVSWFCLARS